MAKIDVQTLHEWLKQNLTLGEYMRLYLLMTEQTVKMQEAAARLEAKERAEE